MVFLLGQEAQGHAHPAVAAGLTDKALTMARGCVDLDGRTGLADRGAMLETGKKELAKVSYQTGHYPQSVCLSLIVAGNTTAHTLTHLNKNLEKIVRKSHPIYAVINLRRRTASERRFEQATIAHQHQRLTDLLGRLLGPVGSSALKRWGSVGSVDHAILVASFPRAGEDRKRATCCVGGLGTRQRGDDGIMRAVRLE